MSKSSIALAQKLSHPFSLAYAIGHAARLHQFRRETLAIQERTESAIALSSAQGFPFFMTQGLIFRGVVLAEQGRAHEGIIQIEEGLAAFRATGAELYRSYFLALLANAYAKAEQVGKGRAILSEALAVLEQTGEHLYDAELYRLKGQLTLQSGQLADNFEHFNTRRILPDSQSEIDAEVCFRRAKEIARQQSAKSRELRATTSLARLFAHQGRRDEAHSMLAEIYNWFTEGFDTTDLKEAKALLEELAT